MERRSRGSASCSLATPRAREEYVAGDTYTRSYFRLIREGVSRMTDELHAPVAQSVSVLLRRSRRKRRDEGDRPATSGRIDARWADVVVGDHTRGGARCRPVLREVEVSTAVEVAQTDVHDDGNGTACERVLLRAIVGRANDEIDRGGVGCRPTVVFRTAPQMGTMLLLP